MNLKKLHAVKEVMDLMPRALQVAIHYGIESKPDAKTSGACEKMKTEGLIQEWGYPRLINEGIITAAWRPSATFL